MKLDRVLHCILSQGCIPLIIYCFFPLSFSNTNSFFFVHRHVDSDNIFFWQAIIVGPPDTSYSERMFSFSIHFIEKYSLAPMNVNLFKLLTS